MNAEFNWWLLIVGLVIGAGLVWLILADSSRRDTDVTARERAGEARWIAEELRRAGRRVDDDDVADVLDLHAVYLSAPPPDEPDEDAEPAEDRGVARSRTVGPGRIDWQPVEGRRPEPNTTAVSATEPTETEGRSGDATQTGWSTNVRTPADRPSSDVRDQPSPSRTG